MDKKKYTIKDITYDGPMAMYTFRIHNKETGNVERVSVVPALGEKYISRHMSFFTENSKLGYTEILELNDMYDKRLKDTEQGISLKAIYKDQEHLNLEKLDVVAPIKIFYKNHGENKWKTLSEASPGMLRMLWYWRDKLEKRKEVTVNESPLYKTKGIDKKSLMSR